MGTAPLINLEEGLAHLRKRQAVLGGVVLSGGEPCIYAGLGDLIREIKELSLPVKLDTNGMCPAMLENLFSSEETRPNYIALDLKISPAKYKMLEMADRRSSHRGTETRRGEQEPEELLKKSAELIRRSGIIHEYRTLVLPGGFITGKDIEELAPLTDEAPWYFRPFRGGNCLDPAWNSMEESTKTASERSITLAEKAKELGKNAISPVNR